jgi:hypothetical protein
MSLFYVWCNHAPTLSLSPNGPKQDSTDPRHLEVPPGVSKIISEPMVRSAQTMHQSCIKIRTISKGTKSSYHLSLVTLEYHRLRLKWFLSLRYVWRNPCNYLTPTPTLSLNGTKWSSTWSTLPWSSIGCKPCKPCTYLAPTLMLSPNGPKRDSTWPTSLRSSIRCVQNDFWAYGTFCANRAPILNQA